MRAQHAADVPVLPVTLLWKQNTEGRRESFERAKALMRRGDYATTRLRDYATTRLRDYAFAADFLLLSCRLELNALAACACAYSCSLA